MDKLLIVQYGITALSSGFNAGYFLTYPTSHLRRRVGAVALAAFSLALTIESIYFGLFAWFRGQEWSAFFLDPGHWLMARLALCLGSVVISVLIWRQIAHKKE